MKNKEDEVKEMLDELDVYKSLDVLSTTDGGKILIENLTKDILSTIDTFCVKYQTLTHVEFIALSAKIKEKIDILRTLTRAEKNKKFITEEIEKLLKDTLQE